MSAPATIWAWQQDPGTPARKLLLVKLADQANDDGVCFPSQRTLAEALGVKDRETVRRHLVALEEAGFIRREERAASNGRRKSNEYHLALGEAREEGGGGPPVAQRGSETTSLELSEGMAPATPSKPRKRNIVWDTVVEHFGEPGTRDETNDFARTVAQVTEALDLDAFDVANLPRARDEIGRRVRAMGDYRSHRSLRTRWAQLGADAHTDPPQVEVDERSAARKPCECIAAGTAPVPDPNCPDCGGTGIADWVS